MSDLSTPPVPDEVTRSAIRQLSDRVWRDTGAPPLSDQALSRLDSPDVTHVVLTRDGRLAGYGQRAGESAEVLATTGADAGAVFDALPTDGAALWSHGRASVLPGVLAARGWQPARILHRLRLAPLAEARTADAGGPGRRAAERGLRLRRFVPGSDDDRLLTVNARAFAGHPEQGSWTRADLRAREAEAWFAADDILLAERDGDLVGFHWTKRHPDGTGEVYVLAVDPGAQGLGLGRLLLDAGLAHLRDRGAVAVILYVDDSNATAMRLYQESGFVVDDTDTQWRA